LNGIKHGCYRNSRLATVGVVAMLTVHRTMRTWSKTVNQYITLSEFARQKLIEGGLPAAKIIVKPNFVNPDPGVGNGEGNYALYVGRLSVEKGLDILLDAWQELNAVLPLKIVGEGPLVPQVNAATRQLSRVEWLGRLEQSEVHRLMKSAKLLIFPSKWYETFGRVAIEAFACGTPVIAANLGAIAELIDPGHTGLLFQPGNSADLVSKVLWLMAHPELMANMRRLARAEFEAKYTAARNYQQLMEIYQPFLRTSRVRPTASYG
jgi:glycosyltransferase involved in cell wall biosynthesis